MGVTQMGSARPSAAQAKDRNARRVSFEQVRWPGIWQVASAGIWQPRRRHPAGREPAAMRSPIYSKLSEAPALCPVCLPRHSSWICWTWWPPRRGSRWRRWCARCAALSLPRGGAAGACVQHRRSPAASLTLRPTPRQVAGAQGPGLHGTTATEAVRFHDDLSTYTGAAHRERTAHLLPY